MNDRRQLGIAVRGISAAVLGTKITAAGMHDCYILSELKFRTNKFFLVGPTMLGQVNRITVGIMQPVFCFPVWWPFLYFC